MGIIIYCKLKSAVCSNVVPKPLNPIFTQLSIQGILVADNLFILNIQFQKIRSKDIAASRTMMEMYIRAVISISVRNLKKMGLVF